MKIKQTILTALLACISMLVSAQKFVFDEVTYTPAATTFKVFAPEQAKVKVQILGRQNSKKMKYEGNGMWTKTVRGNLKDMPYTFWVNGEKTPGVFAKAVGVNGNVGYIIDMQETNPEGWENDARPPLKSPADLVIYEMHHRDFSIDESSGIENKGKFLALTEEKAIRHLKELGVNAVHILPSFDFASVDESRPDVPQYNWGYDPLNYNVPEGSYSTDARNPLTRIREFKQMVQALHKAGIRVILDVVYNHTFDIAGSNFQKTYPDYFYRKNADQSYSNGSGCGNETASEQPMMRRFMTESVKYWANEYHVDGFRFDLMGCHDIETMNAIRDTLERIDPTIFIYGEGWSAGSCALPAERLAMKSNISQLPGIAAFCDDMRDALRGPFNDDTKGAFLAGVAGEEESLKAGIAGMISHPQVDYSKVNYSQQAWALEPTQTINYVSCHDDMCLVDRLKTEKPHITEDELIRLDLLAQTAVFTSQGIPFMLSGEEMLRDKKGVHNSYNSPDSINHLDWNNLQRYPQVFDYYKKLIQLRKNHRAFRLGSAELVRKHLEFLPTQPCVVGYRLKDLGYTGFCHRPVYDERWDELIVILNGNKDTALVNIPQGTYTIIACNGVIDENGLGTVEGGKVSVDGQSALIICKESSYFNIEEPKPEFPGGIEALTKFLCDNLQYPEVDGDVIGKVVISFQVNEDGSLSDYQVFRSLDPMFDNETLRVAKLMPRWKPAMKNGQPVKTRYLLPVAFRPE